MVEIKKDKNVLNKVDGFMNQVYETPEVFVGSTNKVKDSMTDIMSNLYQLAKKNETMVTDNQTDALDQLVTKDFDNEQIWAQIQLYNDPILSELDSKINSFVKTKDNLNIITESNKNKKRGIQYYDDDEEDEEELDEDELEGLELNEDDEEDFDDLEDQEDEEGFEDEKDDLEDEEDDLEDEEDDLEDQDSLDEGIDSDSIKSSKSSKSITKSSIKNNNKNNNNKNVDFFDAKEMEKFLDDEDENEYQRREDEENEDDDDELGDSEEEDGGLDLPEVELDDEERQLDSLLDKYMEKNPMEQDTTSSKKKNKVKNVAEMKFNDFFADPDQDEIDEDDDNFGLEHDDDDEIEEQEEEEDIEQQEEEEEEEEKEEPTLPEEELSAFQKKALKIQERIKKLEKDNLKKKEWTMIGETSAKERPVDSLLGEVLDYEHTQKSNPTITEDTNKSIEDIIKKRILEKNFDDVIRKTEKEFKDNYKKKVEISDEKSQEGLGDVYEKSYMKQVLGVEETDELKQKHIKIYELFNKLCYKLDSLTNFTYTPKMIKNKELNITTASAVTIEEKVPVASSTSTMIAPEEVYFKKNADEKGESELTKEDRIKLRRGYKKEWKGEKKDAEAEERIKEKTDPNYTKKNSIKKSLALLKQERNVTIVDKKAAHRSASTRSGEFFRSIQTSEENRMKGIIDPNSEKAKKKQKLDSMSSKQLKL